MPASGRAGSRRWDEWSEEELGVPDNQGRRMATEDWAERRGPELPVC